MLALVNSGGAAKGSYGAGVISHLLGNLKIDFSILTGVSVGSINSAWISQFPSGQEEQAAESLKNMWLGLTKEKIFKSWKPFGRLHAIHKLSFYDSSPLHNLIKKNISLEKIRLAGKKVCVGTVSVSTGKYHLFDETNDNFLDAVLASSAVPGMFLPIFMKDQIWIDGGMKTLSPIQAAIDLGATEVVVITTSPSDRIKKFIAKPNVVDIVKRAIDVATDKILSNDIDKALMYNKLVDAGISDKKAIKLHIIRPKHNLIEDLLDFSTNKLKEMFDIGFNDATKYCQVNNIASM